MGWYDEAEQGLPPQRHREPTTLRQEILDELTDHLTLAAERESESGGEDDQQIRTRVLKKFGNPAAIARALWWGAMKETLMKDWIQISINAIICIAVVGFMALFYRQMQTTNTALLDALNDRPSAVEDTLPTVEFVFHRGSIEGPPAEGIEVNLYGKAFNEDATTIKEKSDSRGRARFGPIRAGQYRIRLSDTKTGLLSSKKVTLYSNEKFQTIHVPVPPTTQAALDMKSPLAQYAASEDVQLSVFMHTQWSYKDDTWYGISRFVLVTSEGVFDTVLYLKRGDIIRAEERVVQTYGNRLRFDSMNIRRSHYPDESGIEWFRRVDKEDDPYFSSYSTASISHDLQPDGANSILLDLPDALLHAYEYHVRLSANTNHGLPERFSWFPEPVSEEFTDFIIDEARLVEQSLGYHWNDDRYTLHPGIMGVTISDRSAQLFSLKNAPKSIPEGYRLLLAFHGPRVKLNELSANLYAYLDTSAASYDLEEPVENTPFPELRRPVWKRDAKSLDVNLNNNALFVDLTDAIEDDADFKRATGVLFKWEAPSKNVLILPRPERSSDSQQPVWLIMKPIANNPPPNANAN